MISRKLKSGLTSIALLWLLGFTNILALQTLAPSANASTVSTLTSFGDSMGISPFESWKTIETDLFRLTYPESLRSQTPTVLKHLHEAHTLLSPYMNWAPRRRVNVIVLDPFDTANGAAAAALRFGMILYLTPPDVNSGISFYDDWLRLLIIHEYAHILNLDPTRDFYEILRVILGDVVLPNNFWPRWMLEGLAVYAETAFTRAGRGRGPNFDMIFRTASRDGMLGDSRFYSLDQLTGPNPRFPTGGAPYLFGYALMKQLGQTSDDRPDEKQNEDPKHKNTSGYRLLGDLSWESAGRFPFFLNSTVERLTDSDWFSYWEDFIEESKTLSEQQLSQIRAQKVSNLRWLTENGQETYGIEVAPNQKYYAYTERNEDRRFGLWLSNPAGTKRLRIGDQLGGARLSFSPDSRFLFYSKLDRYRQYQLRSDLHVYDVRKNKSIQLSWALRAKDPDLSKADGRTLVYTLTESSRTGLAWSEVTYAKNDVRLSPAQRIWFPKQWGRVSTPKISPNGKHLVFSLHENQNPLESIAILRNWKASDSGQPEILDFGPGFHRYPVWKSDQEILFVSNRNGVDNIYSYHLETKTLTPVSNLETGAAYPFYDAKSERLYASVFKLRGWNLAEIETAKNSYSLTKAPFTIDSLNRPTAPSEPYTVPSEGPDTEERPYSSLRTLDPRQWAPILFWDDLGFKVGGQAAGFDQLDFHNYLVAGAYDFPSARPEGLLIYRNRTLGPTFSFTGSQQIGARSVSAGELDLYTVRSRGTVSVAMPFLFTFSSITPEIRYHLEREKLYEKNPGQNSSRFLASRWRNLPSLDTSIYFDDTETSALAIAPEHGFRTQVGMRTYFNRSYRFYRGLISHQQFVNLSEHTVLHPRATWVQGSIPRSVTLFGRQADLFDRFVNTGLDEVPVRGYPFQAYYVRSAGQLALDLRFPVFRWFRGFGMRPLFFENIHGRVFGEWTRFPKKEFGISNMTSTGAGLFLNTEWFYYIPLQFGVDYHHGFNTRAGGVGEFFVSINAGGISF